MTRWILLALFLLGLCLIVAGLWPWFVGLNAQWTAERHGCIVNAAGAQPCIVDGVDIGHSLARRFNAPFTVIFTIWFSFLGVILVVIALVGALISLFRRKRA